MCSADKENTMKRSKHIIIAGALQVAQSLTLITGAGRYIFIYICQLQEGSQTLDDRMVILALILLYGACLLWFGISLLLQKQWTRQVAGIICCALGLVVFPIGTAISGYTFWVLLQANRLKEKPT
jgi:hypothetical protein